jgi:MFS family permease
MSARAPSAPAPSLFGERRTALAMLVGAGMLSFLAVGAVLPVLPRFVKGPVGAGDVAVGVVTGAFAFTAVVSRPIGGRWADRSGRRTVVIAGMLLSALGSALLFVPAGVPGLVVARLVLGFGEGMMFTAGATWTVDLAHAERRARAIGIFGLAIWAALTLGPLIGEGLYELAGYDVVWAFATAVPLAGALLVRFIPDPHEPVAHPERPPLVPRAAVRPGIALALANVGYAALAGFVVLHLAERGVGSGAIAFTAFAGAVVVTRIFAGRLPDVIGPRPCAIGAATFEAAGLAVIALASSWPAAALGAVLMGFGFSVMFPALALMVVNATEPARRGAALGTFTAFFDIGIGLGGVATGIAVSLGGYAAAFWLGAACAFAPVVAAVVGGRVAARRADVPEPDEEPEPEPGPVG